MSGNNRMSLSLPLSKYDLRVEVGRGAETPPSMVFTPYGVGRGIGRTKNHPKIIGSEVPIAKTRRKSEVFPGKAERAIAEKKKADSPKPDNTNPVKLVLYAWQSRSWHRCRVGRFGPLTRCSGKLLATVLSAPAPPPALPPPVKKPQTTNRATVAADARS